MVQSRLPGDRSVVELALADGEDAVVCWAAPAFWSTPNGSFLNSWQRVQFPIWVNPS